MSAERSGGVPSWTAYRWTLARLKRVWFSMLGRPGVVIACRLPVYGRNPLQPTDDWATGTVFVDDAPLFRVGGLFSRKARSRFVAAADRDVCVRAEGRDTVVEVQVGVGQTVVIVEIFGSALTANRQVVPARIVVSPPRSAAP